MGCNPGGSSVPRHGGIAPFTVHHQYNSQIQRLMATSLEKGAAKYSDFDDVHANLARPLSDATISVRIIKSFEYRTEKCLVLHGLDLEHLTVGGLKERAREGCYR